MEDYYNDDTGKKVIDFLIGFFGLIIIGVLINLLTLYAFNMMVVSDLPFNYIYSIYYLFQFLLIVLAIVFAFIKKRRYIAIGIISAILIPLLIFGACVGIFMFAYTY